MKLKDKISETRKKIMEMKAKHDANVLKNAEKNALKAEKKAQYDKKLMALYKRQDKARKVSDSRKKYQNAKTDSLFKGLGDFGSDLTGSSSSSKKKKNNDYSIF